MAKAIGPFRDSRPLLGSPVPGPKYRLILPLIGPGCPDFIYLPPARL